MNVIDLNVCRLKKILLRDEKINSMTSELRLYAVALFFLLFSIANATHTLVYFASLCNFFFLFFFVFFFFLITYCAKDGCSKFKAKRSSNLYQSAEKFCSLIDDKNRFFSFLSSFFIFNCWKNWHRRARIGYDRILTQVRYRDARVSINRVRRDPGDWCSEYRIIGETSGLFLLEHL